MSTQRIRSPIIRAVIAALATPGHIDDLHERIDAPKREISNAITRCIDRDWIEPVDTYRRDDGRLLIVYGLTESAPDLSPKARPQSGQDRIRELLADTPQSEAQLAAAAGIKPISVRTLLENLRAGGHAVAVNVIDAHGRRYRGWILPPVCVLGQWITGALFRRAA